MGDLSNRGCRLRLAWLTDIHLDHAGRSGLEQLHLELEAARPEAILLGGDIATADTLEQQLRGFAGRVGVPVYFVLGNHDCYGGSIAAARDLARRVTAEPGNLHWLGATGEIALTRRTTLIGHDGWGDGGFGNAESTPVVLNDFLLIDELRQPSRGALLEVLRRLGTQAGEYLGATATRAAAASDQVIVLTHVPPFREAAWHEGAESGPDWLPFFACRAAGEALLAVARRHPAVQFDVLCGHTHSGGVCRPLGNLGVTTGAAVYGSPKVQRIIEVQ